jgi:DNA-binding response OmpR family regulator
MRVLVVEDEPGLGDLLGDFLLELGHRPLVVRSAEAALGKLQTERPDAIILDVHLPGMSGIDFLQLRPVRELGVPIVAVSGVATESQARECLRLGATDFMGKPIPLDRLGEVLSVIEPHALSRLEESWRHDRRASSRAHLSLPIRVLEYGGAEHRGTTVELGVEGLKARLDASLTPRSVVRLSFTPPDAGSAITVMSRVIRADPDGHAFAFVHLPEADTERLRDLIRRRPSR